MDSSHRKPRYSARVVLAAACACGTPALPPAPPAQSRASEPPARRLDARIDVGGFALHLRCEGDGAPTVVFDSGLGRDGSDWFGAGSSIGPAAARLTRACAYDRAGRGSSDPPATKPHSNRQMALELFTLLRNAGERGPFVLVGHSMGGTNVQFFLAEHPESVAGMLLVDASPDAPPIDRVSAEQRAEFERGIDRLEGLDLATLLAGFRELEASGRTLGGKPLVILVAGRVPEEALAQGVPEEVRAGARAELATRQAAQQRLTALSTNHLLVVAEAAGHDIPHDAPELVARAVAALVDSARRGTRLDAGALR